MRHREYLSQLTMDVKATLESPHVRAPDKIRCFSDWERSRWNRSCAGSGAYGLPDRDGDSESGYDWANVLQSGDRRIGEGTHRSGDRRTWRRDGIERGCYGNPISNVESD